MSTLSSFSPVLRRTLAIAAVSAVPFAAARAQTPSGPLASSPSSLFATQDLLRTTPAPEVPAFSSSAAQADGYDATEASETHMASLDPFKMPGANAFQYGQRRRYGAPRYRGGNTNADGSEKYTAYAGGGFASPVGDNSDYLTTGWGFQVGAGRNLNKHFGVNLEFDYDHFGVSGQTITEQSIRYFDDPDNQNGLEANGHIWSFSLQPVYQIYSGQGLGAYITGGVGFYHKVTNFTLPQEEEYCDYYYGCEEFYANENVDHYTSNAPGFDGGIGLTYKFSRFSNERLYAEARYVFIDNKYRPGITDATLTTYTGYNYFPENSNTTSYFPIKFGIRF